MLDRARLFVRDLCPFALALTSLVGCLPKPGVSSAPGVELRVTSAPLPGAVRSCDPLPAAVPPWPSRSA